MAPIISRQAQALPTQLIIPGGPVACRPHGHLPEISASTVAAAQVGTSRTGRPSSPRSRRLFRTWSGRPPRMLRSSWSDSPTHAG